MYPTLNYSPLDESPLADWERPLLAQARQAIRPKNTNAEISTPAPPPTPTDKTLLDRAYAHCRSLTALHSRSFFLASGLLPPLQRQAARALYAFCRTTDDIVDRPTKDTPQALHSWRARALTGDPAQDDLVAVAWTDTARRFHIPLGYAEQLIQGVARDLHQSRYKTFDELTTYCYGVASTVGLMSMYIIGFREEEAIRYAIKLGVALQLTNILRDVAEDWRNGRLYLPLEEMAAFDLSETNLDRGIATESWQYFMRFQIDRTRQLYQESRPGIALLEPEGRLAILAAADFYRRILDDIEAHGYDVFSRRAHVTARGKLRRLPRLWWEARQLRPPKKKSPQPAERQWPDFWGMIEPE
jgi:phytoene synthase